MFSNYREAVQAVSGSCRITASRPRSRGNLRQGRLKPSDTSDGKKMEIHWDMATECGLAPELLMCY